MCQVTDSPEGQPAVAKKPAWWKLRLFWCILFIDLGVSIVLGIPFWKKCVPLAVPSSIRSALCGDLVRQK